MAPKTRSAWRSKIRDLIAFVGHDDLARLTRKEVSPGKRSGRLKSFRAQGETKEPKPPRGVDPEPAEPRTRDRKTIRNVYLAALRATLTFAVKPRGPDGKRREGHRRQGEEEKETAGEGFHRRRGPPIFGRLAGAATEKGLSAEMGPARCWVPLICASRARA